MHIMTVTPNVAIDQTVELDHLVPGQVHRAKSMTQNAGGKGVNVSSCLADWNLKTLATGYLGRDNAAIFEELCRAKGIQDAFIRIDGASRTNVKLVDDAGTTDINLPGSSVSAEKLNELDALAEKQNPENGWAFLCGSLPPGCPENFYETMIARLAKNGWHILLDASEGPLARVLDGSTMPHAIKPNLDELSAWAGQSLDSQAKLLEVVASLHVRGVELVVVSQGKDGALFSDGKQALMARLEAPFVKSTTGAGDAMVAGIGAGLAEQAGLERLARLATAFAVGKLSRSGPHLPGRDEVENLARKVIVQNI